MNDRDMPEMTEEQMLDLDAGYREWAETIQKQNQQHQDSEMAPYDDIEDVS